MAETGPTATRSGSRAGTGSGGREVTVLAQEWVRWSWVNDHTRQLAHDLLQVITQFGGTEFVLLAAVIVAVIEYVRRPSRRA